MAKYLKVVFVCLLVVGFNSSAEAQTFYRDTTLKESLVSVLYQYGKETFYRAIDPQKASYVFQRVLVLDCGHQGAQSFLNKIHQKYPDVSIKIWGCSQADADADLPKAEQKADVVAAEHAPDVTEPSFDDESTADDVAEKEEPRADLSPSAAAPAESAQDNDKLKQSYQNLQQELSALEDKAKEKDSVIADYKEQLSANKEDPSASFEAIAKDQKDLIRIQQSNIDFLKNELAEAQKGQVSGDDEKYGAMHKEIAGTVLSAQEKQMDLAAKDNETRSLKAQLEDLEEQLRLVQEIVNQKNAMIQSLETEVKAIKPVDKQ